NTGKSTVFNALTGLRQHTGNWPGKTVARAEGGYSIGGQSYKLVDLPGTYSLLSTSYDEEIARDFILFGQPDVTVIVVDATRIERNLNLVLQVLEITDRAVVCLNLMDEAKRHGLAVDERRLAKDLGVPVVATSARFGEGLDLLNKTIAEVATGQIVCKPRRIKGQSLPLKSAVDSLAGTVSEGFPELPNARWIALRLLDADERIVEAVQSGELENILAPKTAEDGTHMQTAASRLNAPWDTTKSDKILAEASSLRWNIGADFHQTLMETIYTESAHIADRAVSRSGQEPKFDLDRTIDRLVTSRIFGFPIMVLALTVILWLTISGANVPSAMLATLLLENIHPMLKSGAAFIGMPWWLDGFLIDGMYLGTAWVISVMLPPMAIFFPLFTLLEDFGYLPRVAFNLDSMFRSVGAHGKQSLTMAMGFGCNAAGVVATRIIESPRERLIAIITNNFALCNGRWPTQIMISSIFIGGLAPAHLAGLLSALTVVSVAMLGVFFTFATSWFLSRTVLRGEVSTFSLELPPYRPPRIFQTIYTSMIDRTLLVLWRAVIFALPAGALLWLISNIPIGDISLAQLMMNWLDPFGYMVGLSGLILLTYIIAIPANEIIIPTILMLTVLSGGMTGVGEGSGVMFELDSEGATAQLLKGGGWNLLIAVNVLLFSLVHNPCSTTIYTIWKETRSGKWTAVSALLPVVMGFALCFVVAQVWRLVAGGGY
ncbi:MAG: ferrous iron transport protein B, partial [Nitrospinaceae bacterium]|nr:ferrous iron transport protein B [Nitrospinaceae bacterium]